MAFTSNEFKNSLAYWINNEVGARPISQDGAPCLGIDPVVQAPGIGIAKIRLRRVQDRDCAAIVPFQKRIEPTVKEFFNRSRYYRTLAPELPDSLREMEPLFLAVICGCNAGLYRGALHEVFIPRIQRGNAYFAAKVLGATGSLLSMLVHFFEHGR